MLSAGIAMIYKVAGYGFITALSTELLNKMGKPMLAKVLHIVAWATLGLFTINYMMDHLRIIARMW